MKATIRFTLFFSICFLILFLTSCTSDDSASSVVKGIVTDIDGNLYQTITIGNQTWMVENLRTTKYSNGDEINLYYKGDTTIITNIGDNFKCDTIHVKYNGKKGDVINVVSKKDKKIKANYKGDLIYIITKGDTIQIKRNSLPIDVVKNTVWAALDSLGAQCTYNNTVDKDTLKTFGRLYNYSAVTDTRNIAPAGWRVPTKADWLILENYLNSHYGENITAKAIAADKGWTLSTDTYAIGNDLSLNNQTGFGAVPGGIRDYKGAFVNAGSVASLWTNSVGLYSGSVWYLGLFNYYKDLIWSTSTYSNGLSIRCVKN